MKPVKEVKEVSLVSLGESVASRVSHNGDTLHILGRSHEELLTSFAPLNLRGRFIIST